MAILPGRRQGSEYCLHDGRWFVIEKTYADHVREQTASIFARDHGLASLPVWPAGKDEDEYNKILADHLDGIVLDRKLLRSDFHRYGIEACDVLLKDNTFVHVKLIESSAPASHLIAQALVSVETLTYDQEAQAAFRERVEAAGWDGGKYSGKPKRVVLVLARVGKEIDAASLFTFTQVNLWAASESARIASCGGVCRAGGEGEGVATYLLTVDAHVRASGSDAAMGYSPKRRSRPAVRTCCSRAPLGTLPHIWALV